MGARLAVTLHFSVESTCFDGSSGVIRVGGTMFQSIVALNDGRSAAEIGVGVAGRLAELCRCPWEVAVLDRDGTEDDQSPRRARDSNREYRVARDAVSGLAGFLESHRHDLLVHVIDSGPGDRQSLGNADHPLFQ